MKKNILIIKNPIESQGFSGGEIHTLQIANYMRDCGNKVYFAGTCPDLLNAAKEEGFPIQFLKFGGQEAVDKIAVIKFFFTWPFVYFKYKKYLKKMRDEKSINILYLISWNEKFLLAPIASRLGMKVFFVEHRLLEKYIQYNPFKLFYVYGSKYARIIAVSKAVEKGLIKMGIEEDRISIIYNGIEINKFIKVKKSFFSKKNREVIIGTISRFSKDKGLNYLIYGFKLAQETMPNLRLKIVGSGHEEKELKNMVQKLNIKKSVEFLGRLSNKKEIPEFLNSIDVFVLSSLWGESFGIVLAEAGIMEKPSIVTNVGGMPEVIKDKETGLIIKPRNSREISKTILYLSQNPNLAKKMGTAAKNRIINNFSVDIMLKKINNIFEGKNENCR